MVLIAASITLVALHTSGSTYTQPVWHYYPSISRCNVRNQFLSCYSKHLALVVCTIGTNTRDFATCSVVPSQQTPYHAWVYNNNIVLAIIKIVVIKAATVIVDITTIIGIIMVFTISHNALQ